MRTYWVIGVAALMVVAVFSATYCAENECRASDLHVWFFSDADKTMNVLTFILVLIALRQIAEARTSKEQQAKDTLEALKVSRDAADAATKANVLTHQVFAGSERPWVSLKAHLMSGLSVDSNGASVIVRFAAKNLGDSPAQFVMIHSKVIASRAFDPRREMVMMIESALGKIPTQNFGSFVLFPGDEESQIHVQGLSYEEMKAAAIGAHDKPRILPTIIGLVEYCSMLDNTRHYSAIVVDLSRIDANQPGNVFAIDVGPEGIPKSQLALHLSSIAGSVAN